VYEVRHVICDPYALDGPVIVRTEDLGGGQAAIHNAARDFPDQLCVNAAGATDAVFVTVLIGWSSYTVPAGVLCWALPQCLGEPLVGCDDDRRSGRPV